MMRAKLGIRVSKSDGNLAQFIDNVSILEDSEEGLMGYWHS